MIELPNTDPIAAIEANICRCRAAAANAVWDTTKGWASASTELSCQGVEGIYGRWHLFAHAFVQANGDVVLTDGMFCLN